MKFGICQELFVGWDWEKQCDLIAEIGYTGIELAPFAFAERPSDISAEQRAFLRKNSRGSRAANLWPALASGKNRRPASDNRRCGRSKENSQLPG